MENEKYSVVCPKDNYEIGRAKAGSGIIIQCACCKTVYDIRVKEGGKVEFTTLTDEEIAKEFDMVEVS